MDGDMGNTAWGPEGREGQSQAGPKGRKLEVRLLVSYIYAASSILVKLGSFIQTKVPVFKCHYDLFCLVFIFCLHLFYFLFYFFSLNYSNLRSTKVPFLKCHYALTSLCSRAGGNGWKLNLITKSLKLPTRLTTLEHELKYLKIFRYF